jgi:hypothetical protein
MDFDCIRSFTAVREPNTLGYGMAIVDRPSSFYCTVESALTLQKLFNVVTTWDDTQYLRYERRAGVNLALAAQLAPKVADDITKNHAAYNRTLLKQFQMAAGLAGDGVYDSFSAGAVQYFLHCERGVRIGDAEPALMERRDSRRQKLFTEWNSAPRAGSVPDEVPARIWPSTDLYRLVGRCLCIDHGLYFMQFAAVDQSGDASIFQTTPRYAFSLEQLEAARYLTDYAVSTPAIKGGIWREPTDHAIYRACTLLDVTKDATLTRDHIKAFEFIASLRGTR